jgi:thiol-disulfide isomerase/thioredoxin
VKLGKALLFGTAAALGAGIGVYFYGARQEQATVESADLQIPAAQLVATVPDFTLNDRMGRPRSLADWPDKALIVNFWATWCAPCRREIPLLQRLQAEHGAAGFQVIGIAVDFRDAVLQYAEEMNIEYPILIGEQDGLDAASAFGVEAVGFPFTIFSDRQGRVVAAHVGELTAAQAEVIVAAVEAVDDGRLSPIQARARIESELKVIGKNKN